MVRFWLATFEFPGDVSVESAGVPLGGPSPAWAIEVLHEPVGDEWAVLFCTADDALKPTQLTCRLAFATGAKSCGLWRERGFPVIEALATSAPGKLALAAALFVDQASELDYGAVLAKLDGLTAQLGAAAAGLSTIYEQRQYTTDPVFPASKCVERAVAWAPQRYAVHKLPKGLTVTAANSRWPSLAPFAAGVPATAKAAWTGDIDLPAWPPAAPPGRASRCDRKDTFGVAAFRFEEVEAIGCGVQLPCAIDDPRYLRLLKPLNFHLDHWDGHATPDFRYAPATRTVNFEILRYGRMKLSNPTPPLTPKDFQAQHELMLRILVGRVDDDTSQARDPAAFVPAIFVDNSWSKALGRDIQGYDKRLADFCVLDGGQPERLAPNGRRPGAAQPTSLGHVRQVRLLERTGAPAAGPVLLEMACEGEKLPDWDAFKEVDLELALASASLTTARWGQSDFEAPEFRRGFARQAQDDELQGFRCIQAAPVCASNMASSWDAQRTWIPSTLTVTGPIRMVQPRGQLTLTFHKHDDAPRPWNDFCDLLNAPGGRVSVPAGGWYRMRFDMDMKVEDELG